jgi:hypothetical protein
MRLLPRRVTRGLKYPAKHRENYMLAYAKIDQIFNDMDCPAHRIRSELISLKRKCEPAAGRPSC